MVNDNKLPCSRKQQIRSMHYQSGCYSHALATATFLQSLNPSITDSAVYWAGDVLADLLNNLLRNISSLLIEG